jgi:hypothetical protein
MFLQTFSKICCQVDEIAMVTPSKIDSLDPIFEKKA